MENEALTLTLWWPDQPESHGITVCDEITSDFISKLPDAILVTIISLLPTKDGGRMSAVSPRWCHLWRSTPLNLEVRTPPCGYPVSTSAITPAVVSKIISQHPVPIRRFSFQCFLEGDLYTQLESWLHSQALANLQELDINYQCPHQCSEPRNPLPPSVFRSASTLLVAKFSYCDFPDEVLSFTNFPLLKQLSLVDITISWEVFHRLLSGCHALESFYMSEVRGKGCLRVSSRTLRSIGVRNAFKEKLELVIEDAPCLVRVLLPFSCYDDDCVTMRVIWAPKLEILGPLLPVASKLIAQVISPVMSANWMRTVKVFCLRSSGLELNAVLNILRWFPYLEKLYIIFQRHNEKDKKNDPQYDPLHPIECLQTHLKNVVFKSFVGYEKQVNFARFFVLHAKVENRASRDAQFEFRSKHRRTEYDAHIHDLSVADPFAQP
ncbi:F-box/FBD/LRR-repeat protein At1g13570-like [Triticum dicoccoides]|uniref:F-box/FBD/LRR-repeat protein At1g13570-like n=1 Tax=Triticum dicoccoides TaxID=85692 RepID=UPI0018915B71|nr:F-box/FBD/LRR-repeat protein At1g13570-like [Triticum dicoccoides]